LVPNRLRASYRLGFSMNQRSERSAGIDGGPHPLYVLRAGDAVPSVAAQHGEFFAWIQRAAGDVWSGTWREHDLRGEDPLPDPRLASGIIITGSAASVTERAPWMLRTEAYLREAHPSGTPILGICFGHQLLAQALGGEVSKNPCGREMGTVELSVHEHDTLFEGLPRVLPVNATHVDSVARLPPNARVVGSTSLEQHAVIAFGPRTRGVQFHPEIDGAVMRGYVEARRQQLSNDGLDADAILSGCRDTPLSLELLRNFLRYFVAAPVRRAA
jgi:GMP synthase (glutamine-hydrolysing)